MAIKLWRNIKPEFVDDRGEILKILDDGKTVIKSILLITSKKGSIRANHYHKKDSHYCYVVSGKIEYIEEDIDGTNREIVVLHKGDLFYTPPLKAHAMRFLEDTAFLTLSPNSRHQEAYEDDLVRVKLI